MEMALTFNDIQFDIVDRENQPWIRSPQIGEALGYAKGSISISKLYDSHADEFTDSMTALVKLPTEGGEQETRIFSLRGCHLLAMLARTPVAKSFRKWVLDVLERIAKEENQPQSTDAPLTPDQQCTIQSIVKAKVDAVPASLRERGLYPQIYKRFNNHFRIAKYCQLPQSKLAEAIEYLVKMDVRVSSKKLIEDQQEPNAISAAKNKYEAYLEDVETVRQKTMIELSRLLRKGLDLLDVYKFKTAPFHMFTPILIDWLAKTVTAPTEVRYQAFADKSPVALIEELSRLLPDMRK